jgi:hypothetical protein
MSYYVWFLVFAVVAYFIVTDESAAAGFYYMIRIITNKFLVFKWWMLNNPKTPWTRYSMHRRSIKMAEELMKEFEEKNK